MISYYLWLTIFGIILYLVVTEYLVARVVIIGSRWLKLQYEKAKWWILHSPTNPIVKYMIWRRSWKIAKELRKELQNDRMD